MIALRLLMVSVVSVDWCQVSLFGT
jgi:hypothetical protein